MYGECPCPAFMEPQPRPQNFLPPLPAACRLGGSSLPPLPIAFRASGSWRQLGRPTNFSPGHFLTPSPPSACFFSLSAPFERRHPGPERVLQFNYFQILCSGHPGTPLSAIESAGRPAGAPVPGRPESIRPLPGPLRPTDAPASPGRRRPLPPGPSTAALSCPSVATVVERAGSHPVWSEWCSAQ